MIYTVILDRYKDMKKLMMAGLCGLCMMAACAFVSGSSANVAGSGSDIHIRA